MAFELSPVNVEDLPELATLGNTIGRADPDSLMSYIFPMHIPEIIDPWRLQRMKDSFNESSSVQSKITDTTNGKIVAYAAWEIPRPSGPAQEPSTVSKLKEQPDSFYPEGSKIPIIKQWYGTRDVLKKKHVNSEEDYGKNLSDAVLIPQLIADTSSASGFYSFRLSAERLGVHAPAPWA